MPLSLFPGIEVKPTSRAALETWIGGSGSGQSGSYTPPMATHTAPASEAAASQSTTLSMDRAAEQASALRVTVAADRGPNALYYLGETIRYDIRANQDSYVYVWNVTEGDNKMTLLFPNQYQRDNFVKGGRVTTIGNAPAKDGSWTISPPTGRETLMVWALPATQQFADYDEKRRHLEKNLFWEEPIRTEAAYQAVKRKSVTMLPYNLDGGSGTTVVVTPIEKVPSEAEDKRTGSPAVPVTAQAESVHRPSRWSQESGCDSAPGVFCYQTTYTSLSQTQLVPSRRTP